MTDKTTHFGYEQVDWKDKQRRVAGVFDSVAENYDLMNDALSFGIHRLWKRFAVEHTGARPGQTILDLAGGTGDLAARLSRLVGAEGEVIIADINPSMLGVGREHLLDKGIAGNVDFVQANAESLPFPDGSFDCITIAFGLRNVTDKPKALESMYRALKPGGRVLILEFSKPVIPGLRQIYDIYSFSVLPVMGRLIAKDEKSYRYLAESIRMHPDQENLKIMMEQAGFEDCDYFNLTGGIVALHRGFRF